MSNTRVKQHPTLGILIGTDGHEQHVRYYAENPDKVREQTARSYKNKCKTHRVVQFSDGSKHWIPRTESEALLKIPLKERVFKR